jgi:SAM-dependent methyltransferase
MIPFLLEAELPYHISIWRRAITESLQRLNSAGLTGPILLELAGGSSPLAGYVSHEWIHIVVDKMSNRLRNGTHFNIIADVCRLPIKNDTASLIITISSLQYFDHQKFFSECYRVLQPDGIIAVHENGPANPFIWIARFAQRLLGLINKKHWHYRNTIQRYYRPSEVPVGFEVIYTNFDGILTPIVFMLELLHIPGISKLIPHLHSVDKWLLESIPTLNQLTFLNVVHLRKIGSTLPTSVRI